MERSENLHSCKIFSKIQEWASQLSLSLCGRKRFELDFISLSIMSSQIDSDELRVTRLYGTSNPFFNGTSVSILSLIGRYVYKIRHETLIEYNDSRMFYKAFYSPDLCRTTFPMSNNVHSHDVFVGRGVNSSNGPTNWIIAHSYYHPKHDNRGHTYTGYYFVSHYETFLRMVRETALHITAHSGTPPSSATGR